MTEHEVRGRFESRRWVEAQPNDPAHENGLWNVRHARGLCELAVLAEAISCRGVAHHSTATGAGGAHFVRDSGG